MASTCDNTYGFGSSKDLNGEDDWTPSSLGGFGSDQAKTNGYKPRKSDWICTSSRCAARNFGNRVDCFKCHEEKGDAQDAPADSSGFTPRQRTEWYCTDSSCGGKNFGNRTECFKCHEPKGDAQDVPADPSSGPKPRANDWICTNSSCSASNFGSRFECYKCHEAKGDAQDAPADGGGFTPRQRVTNVKLKI